MIEIEGPDGIIYEFPAGTDDATIKTAMGKVYGAPQQQTVPAAPEIVGGVIMPPAYDQQGPAQPASMGAKDFIRHGSDMAGDALAAGAAGVSRGVTGMADLPGMLVGGAGNLAAAGVEKLGAPGVAQGMRESFGMMPMGGGDLFRGGAAAATGGASEYQGESLPAKFAGTVGEFLPGAMLPGASAANAVKFGVLPGLASEGAGQMTEGTAAEPWARAIAPMLTSLAVAKLTQPQGAKAPTVDELRAQADDLYRAGAARPGAEAADVRTLAGQIDNELSALNIKTPTGRVLAEGNVKRFLDVLEDFDGQAMKPEQMQSLRRILTDAAGSADPADRRIGARLLEQFDQWRGQHVPEYRQADQLYGRMKRAQDVDFRIQKAENRAASSGSGGNTVNATRQNIRQILDNPKALRGYSPDEIAAMRQIVRGSPGVNAMRNVGKLSPTSGALPLLGSLTGIGVAPQLTIPAMGVAAASKGGAEILTRREIRGLVDMILNGGAVAARPSAGYDTGLLTTLLGVNAGRE